MNDLNDINLKELIETEMGDRFNRQGYIKCPFHNEKTPSLKVKFFPDKNKSQFHCFGCEQHGDAIDFIMKYRNLDYTEARKCLGMDTSKTEKENKIDKIHSYIEWELKNFRKGSKLLGIFTFVDEGNNPIYYKAKFLGDDKKKTLAYYHINNEDKVISKRGIDEIPYNLHHMLKAFESGKIVVVCEGEKDANTINEIFKNKRIVATSMKGVKDFERYIRGHRVNIYICSDTGKAGDDYKWKIYHEVFKHCKEFKFISLPGLKRLGDNKDVTDWLSSGKTKKDLQNAFDRSLDLKNKYELQQDKGGIYKTIIKEKNDDVVETKKYITNFSLLEATRINMVDDEQEGVKLILKSPTGSLIEKSGPVTVFDDTKSFKNFLGTLDLVFKGRIEDLNDLKAWVNQYFALEVEELYQGIKFINRCGKLMLVTNQGAIYDQNIDETIKSDGKNNTNIINIERISKEELKELKKNLFKFCTPEKSISIIGTVINNLAVHQNIQSKNKLHHLLVVGESGSGKSTILENVISPLLNYNKTDIKSIGLTSPFAIIKCLSEGNYPMLFDEFKPSYLDRYKQMKLSDIFRNLYDRTPVSRGDKSFKTKDFILSRPLILVGEENFPNQETAQLERTCIVYVSKRERTEEHTKAMEWIIKNEELLKKLNRSLIDIVLTMTVEDYKGLREKVENKTKGLKNRVLTTSINIGTGMEIFNLLLASMGIKEINNYMEYIVKNIKEEILNNGSDTRSVVEQMICLYSSMIEDGRAYGHEDVVRYRNDGIFIRTSEMINQIQVHCKQVGADIIPLNLRDFKKQAQKSGYISGTGDKVIKVSYEGGKPKSCRFDTYNLELLRNLKVDSIVPPELMEVDDEESKIIPFK